MDEDMAPTSEKESAECSNALLVWRFDARTVEVEVNEAGSTDAEGGTEPRISSNAAVEDPASAVLPHDALPLNDHGIESGHQGAVLEQDMQTDSTREDPQIQADLAVQ